MSGKSCLTCKWKQLTEDNFDGIHKGLEPSGRRLVFQCGRNLAISKGDRRDTPLMTTVVERESSPAMKKETSFMGAFHCCYWEKI